MSASLFPDTPRKRQPQGAHPDCIRAWETAWLRTRGAAWAWTPKDAALIAKALKLAGGDVGVVTARINRLLEEADDEWLARNADPGQLVRRWNLLAVEPPKKNKVAPLPAYRPDPGPRIPPPANLMEMYKKACTEAKQRNAQRLPKPGATNAPSG